MRVAGDKKIDIGPGGDVERRQRIMREQNTRQRRRRCDGPHVLATLPGVGETRDLDWSSRFR